MYHHCFMHPHPLQAYLDVSQNLIDDLDTVQDLPDLQVSVGFFVLHKSHPVYSACEK